MNLVLKHIAHGIVKILKQLKDVTHKNVLNFVEICWNDPIAWWVVAHRRHTGSSLKGRKTGVENCMLFNLNFFW